MNRKDRMTRIARIAYIGLAWLLVACIAVQTYLAGAATFADASHLNRHTAFVHIFEIAPLLMLALAFAGRQPAALRWRPLAMFALIIAQYATANAPAAGALHPVIALVLFALALATARKASQGASGTTGGDPA